MIRAWFLILLSVYVCLSVCHARAFACAFQRFDFDSSETRRNITYLTLC
jgi:hypothetical protein